MATRASRPQQVERTPTYPAATWWSLGATCFARNRRSVSETHARNPYPRRIEEQAAITTADRQRGVPKLSHPKVPATRNTRPARPLRATPSPRKKILQSSLSISSAIPSSDVIPRAPKPNDGQIGTTAESRCTLKTSNKKKASQEDRTTAAPKTHDHHYTSGNTTFYLPVLNTLSIVILPYPVWAYPRPQAKKKNKSPKTPQAPAPNGTRT